VELAQCAGAWCVLLLTLDNWSSVPSHPRLKALELVTLVARGIVAGLLDR
jgi:hypothetical protein